MKRQGPTPQWTLGSMVCLMACAACMGCAHRPGEGYIHGQAAKAAFQAQCLHPEGAENPAAPPEGMPGALANKIYQQRYVDSMTREIRGDDERDRSRGDSGASSTR